MENFLTYDSIFLDAEGQVKSPAEDRTKQPDIRSFIHILDLDLALPVPFETFGDESPPSAPITGGPPCIMPADTHLGQVFP